MKKFIVSLLLCLSVVAASYAQAYQTYRATSYAIADINQYSGRYSWSDWYKCNVKIVFNMNDDVIVIYSNSPQRYDIISQGQSSTDSSGGQQVSFSVIDQDGDRGTLRLRIERNGNSQIYIDFSNCGWVYNVSRVN